MYPSLDKCVMPALLRCSSRPCHNDDTGMSTKNKPPSLRVTYKGYNECTFASVVIVTPASLGGCSSETGVVTPASLGGSSSGIACRGSSVSLVVSRVGRSSSLIVMEHRVI